MYSRDSVISLAPREFLSGEGIQLGRSVTGRSVSIRHELLSRHLLILGRTGTGKSNMLKQIVHGIVETRSGSVVVFDPHGDLGKAISCDFPDRTLVISPFGVGEGKNQRWFSLNAIGKDSDKDERNLAIGWIKDAFSSEGVFSHGTWGPRLEVVFSSILSELVKKRENATLSDLLDLLLDAGKMRRFISAADNQQLKLFLKMQMADWKGWNQYVSSSINKLMPLMTHNGTRNLVAGRRDSLNLVQYMREGIRVVVPEIWKDVLPEDSYRVISILLLLKIWQQSVMERPENRKPIYIVLDESQMMPEGILDRLLREGRKFGLHTIMATQFLDSDTRRLTETIRGNISNILSFSLSEKDSGLISSNFFSGKLYRKVSDTLKSQQIHRAVIWSQNETGISGPLSFSPTIRDDESDLELFDRIRKDSLERYGIAAETEETHDEPGNLHEFLIQEFQKFLQKKSVETDRNRSFGGIYPDLVFTMDGTTFFVEVEVSDLLNFGRIGEKIVNYSGKNLVFLVPPESSRHLFGKILYFLIKNDTRIHDRIPGRNTDIISRISIVEFSNGFHFLAAGRLRSLRMEHLNQGSFMRTLRENKYAEIRKHVYTMMVTRGTFSMKYPKDALSKVFGKDNSLKAGSYLIGNSGFITIRDLFMEKVDDKET